MKYFLFFLYNGFIISFGLNHKFISIFASKLEHKAWITFSYAPIVVILQRAPLIVFSLTVSPSITNENTYSM